MNPVDWADRYRRYFSDTNSPLSERDPFRDRTTMTHGVPGLVKTTGALFDSPLEDTVGASVSPTRDFAHLSKSGFVRVSLGVTALDPTERVVAIEWSLQQSVGCADWSEQEPVYLHDGIGIFCDAKDLRISEALLHTVEEFYGSDQQYNARQLGGRRAFLFKAALGEDRMNVWQGADSEGNPISTVLDFDVQRAFAE